MSYRYHWKPSKSAKKEFAEKMSEIDAFCRDHNIDQSSSSDSYYFSIDGHSYRVSNHTIEASNKGAYNDFGEQVRALYHPDGRNENTTYITASKTRIIEIYNDLKAGYQLDKRGYRKLK